MNDKNSELDHPCKATCSGWQQGYEKGHQRFLQEDDNRWKSKCTSLQSRLSLAVEALEFYAESDTYDSDRDDYRSTKTWQGLNMYDHGDKASQTLSTLKQAAGEGKDGND